MVERSEISELLLVVTSVITFALLAVCPGMLFAFFLPPWIGLPVMLACGSIGPWIMWTVDRSLYGERP